MEQHKKTSHSNRKSYSYPNLLVITESENRFKIDIPYTGPSDQAEPKTLQFHLKLPESLKENDSEGPSLMLINETIEAVSRGLWKITRSRTVMIALDCRSDLSCLDDSAKDVDPVKEDDEIWAVEVGSNSAKNDLNIIVISQISKWNVLLNVTGKGGHSSLKPLTVSPVLPVCEFRVGAERIFREEFEEFADKNLFLTLPKITTTDVKNVIPDTSSLAGFIQSTEEDVTNAFGHRLQQLADSIASKRKVKIELTIQPQDQLFVPRSFDKNRLEQLTEVPVTIKLEMIQGSINDDRTITKTKLRGRASVPDELESATGKVDFKKAGKIVAGLILDRISQ